MQIDPFYSCTRVKNECLADTEENRKGGLDDLTNAWHCQLAVVGLAHLLWII